MAVKSFEEIGSPVRSFEDIEPVRPQRRLNPNEVYEQAKKLSSLTLDQGIPAPLAFDLINSPHIADPNDVSPTPRSVTIGGKYKNFWDELQRATAGAEANVGGGLAGTLSKAISDLSRHPMMRMLNQGTNLIPDRSVIKVASAADEIKRVSEFLYKLAEDEEFAPSEGSGFSGFVARSVGQALPYMTASMLATVATGTPAAAFGVAYAVEGDNAYRDAIKRGASEEESRMEGLIVGTINGAIETAQIGQIFKTAGLNQTAIKHIIKNARDRAWDKVGKHAGQLTMNVLKNSINEGLQESIQETVSISAPHIRGMDLEGAFKAVIQEKGRIAEAGAGGAVVGGVMSAGATVTAKSDQSQEAKIERELEGPRVVDDTPDGAIQKLLDSAIKAKAAVPSIQEEQHGELSRKVGIAASSLEKKRGEGVTARRAFNEALSNLAGENAQRERVYDSIREELGEDTVESLEAKIVDDADLQLFEKKDVLSILDRLIDGNALTMREAGVIEQYFGGEFAEVARKRVPFEERMWEWAGEVANIPRTALSTLDQSGILRQARPLGQGNPKEYLKMIWDYQKAFWSEESAQRIEKEYKSDPMFKEFKDLGGEMPLYSGLNRALEDMSERFLAARIMQNIPGVKASERSFVVPLNAMRLAVYKKVVGAAAGKSKPLTVSEKRRLIQRINDLSGRSSVGKNNKKVQRFLPFLNAVLFSARFTYSRIKPLVTFPADIARSVSKGKITKETSQAAWAYASLAATNLAVMFLIKAFDTDDEVEISPDLRSTDGGKIRIGDQRIDLWAGYQQPARLLWQIATGEKIDQSGEVIKLTMKDRQDLVLDFIRTKRNPFFSLVADAWAGEDMFGNPFGAPPKGKIKDFLDNAEVADWLQGAGKETLKRITPLIIQDVTDALALQGVESAAWAATLAFFGAGVNTYEATDSTKAKIKKNEIAEKEYGKRWNDLTERQQQKLRRDYEDIAITEEQARATRNRLTEIDLTKQNESADRISKNLSDDVRGAIIRAGVSPGVSKKIGKDFYLNDERYAEYERLAAETINKRVSLRIKSNSYKKNPMGRSKMISDVVSKAKEEARSKLMRDIERQQ